MPWDDSTRRSRLPKDWRTIRLRILERDGYRCTWIQRDGSDAHPGIINTGQRCTEQATDVDHRIRGDDHSDSNLQSLCRRHHLAKTQKEAAAARWHYKAQRPPEKHPGLL